MHKHPSSLNFAAICIQVSQYNMHQHVTDKVETILYGVSANKAPIAQGLPESYTDLPFAEQFILTCDYVGQTSTAPLPCPTASTLKQSSRWWCS